MKKSTVLLTSLLLLALAAASTLEIVPKHVYAGESFDVKFSTAGPTNQHTLELKLIDQVNTVYIDRLEAGNPQSNTITFKAPPQPGEYEITSDEGKAKVTVEAPVFKLSGVKMEPAAIQPRESAKLSYTIENIGDTPLYDVKGLVTAQAGSESDYDFSSGNEELFTSMGRGEKRTVVKEITARESAKGSTTFKIEVAYNVDGEIHYLRADAPLSAGGMPWLELIVILVLVVVVGRVVLAKYVG
jgi:hypothetical protein